MKNLFKSTAVVVAAIITSGCSIALDVDVDKLKGNDGSVKTKNAAPVVDATVVGKNAKAAPVLALPPSFSGVFNGNRYMHERHYAGDISAARAYLESQIDGAAKTTIVDVRDASEFAAGHPKDSVHIPFPRVFQDCNTDPTNPSSPVFRSEDGGSCTFGTRKGTVVNMSPKEFFDFFEARFPSKGESYALLCSTGSRSAHAGNILANPEKFIGPEYKGRGYTNVKNIWEGFVGMPMAPIDPDTRQVLGTSAAAKEVVLQDKITKAYAFKPAQLDLNNDGKLDQNDLDGWRYHQGLPWIRGMNEGDLNQKAQPYYGKK